ncbi:MAG: hypothetical protein HZB38_12580 [Planctomycetes bacterium]|nr:hypothetical protein [Planctomycetota bacterium]
MPAKSAAAETRINLPSGEYIYVPAAIENTTTCTDVLVHFHGAPSVVQREFSAAGARAVLVVVNFSGLSAAYEKPLGDPARFAATLDDTLAELKRSGRIAPGAHWRRVCVSSFSAGYGAVRAVLRAAEHFQRIDAIYLADSLYAGYAEHGGARTVDPASMGAFRAFAAEAAAGRKFLFVTHSYLEPGRYAGTHETADDLIGSVGAVRIIGEERFAIEGINGSLRIISKVDAGGFHVRGCAGTTGEDHMAHLRLMRFGVAALPIEHTP